MPPYNPAPSERRLWLLSSDTPAEDQERLTASTGISAVMRLSDGAGLVERVRALQEDAVLVAPPAVLAALVLELVGGRAGTARLRFVPGALSQMQMLSDRAVLRHLNLGADL